MNGIGRGLFLSGVMFVVNAGMAVGATTIWGGVLGLVLMLLGAVIMVMCRSPKED
jgi:hypothetical protein